MSTASVNNEAVTFDQAAKAFQTRYPNWQENPCFSEVFSKLKDLTRIDRERTAEPEKVFTCLLDQSKISFTEVKQYTGRLDLQDWFVIFAFFAGCDIQHFSGRFNRLINKNSGKHVPLGHLKSILVHSGTADDSISLESYTLTRYERDLLEHCINSVDSESAPIQVKRDSGVRKYKTIGRAHPVTKRAAKALSCSHEKIYDVREKLANKNLLWVEGGKESREKSKRIAIWKMLL